MDFSEDPSRESFSHMHSRLASESTGSVGRPSWAGYLGLEDSDKVVEKRNALNLTAIRVAIDKTELSRSRKDGTTFTAYVLAVSSGQQTWNVRRRYTDFCFVHQQLQKQKLAVKLPSLPPKKYFGSSKDHSFIEDRRVKLEAYLNNLFPNMAVWATPLLVTFLDNPSNTLMYLWNLERMRKMQTMITTMDLQSRDETYELNAELQHAREQVKQLQDRVKRMEMLFLQGAAGVSQGVDGETLRSISIGGEGRIAMHSGNSSDLEGNEERSLEGIEDHIPFLEDERMKTKLAPEEVVEVLNLTQNIAELIEQAEMAAMLPVISQSDRSLSRGMKPQGRSVSVDMLKRTMSADSLSKTPRDTAFAMSVRLQETVELSNKVLNDTFRIQSQIDSNRTSHTSAPVDFPTEGGQYLTESTTIEDIDVVNDILDFEVCKDGLEPLSDIPRSWVQRLIGRFDEVIRALQPSQDAIQSRNSIYQYLRGIVWNILGVEIFPVGSFVGRIFLLEGDLDMTVILPKNVESNSWFVKLNEVLCMAAMGLTGTVDSQPFLRMQVNNISFINAEVKIIKATINNISVDISANQIGAVYAQAFVEQCDEFVGQNHLLKRSILLMKAWCANESARFIAGGIGDECGSLFGSNKGRLSSYSIIVMMIWIFNAYGAKISSPVQALMFFLKYYSDFDWYQRALTVHGAVCIEDLSPLSAEDAKKEPRGGFLPEHVLRCSSSRYAELGKKKMHADLAGVAQDKQPNCARVAMKGEDAGTDDIYMRGIINIIDPVKIRKNITRSVDGPGFNAIRGGFRRGYAAFLDMARQCRVVPLFRPEDNGAMNAAAAMAMKNADVPLVRSFLSNTTSVLKNAGRGRFRNEIEADPFNSPIDEIESWIRHVELVFSPLSREALGSLVYHILKVKGPVPVGEVGKGLQEMTNNNSITDLIKAEFKGLKKLIEMCPEYFIVGTEHPFNPIVAVRPDATPYITDLSFIVSSLVPAVYGPANKLGDNTKVSVTEEPIPPRPPPPPAPAPSAQSHQQLNAQMREEHFYPMQKGGSFKGEYASHNRAHTLLSAQRKAGSFIHVPPQRSSAGPTNLKNGGGQGNQKRSDSFSSATTSNPSDPDTIYYGSYDASSYSSANEYMLPLGASPEVNNSITYYPAPQLAAPTSLTGQPVGPSSATTPSVYSPARRQSNNNRDSGHNRASGSSSYGGRSKVTDS